jgi:RNA polymerase sigma-70 factor (ECF subfamily)
MDPPGAAAKIRRFEEQILPHLPDLYRAARRLVGRVDAAEDLVQDTCLRAFGALDQLRHPEAARAWVFSILRSVFLRNAARWDPVRPTGREPDASPGPELGPQATPKDSPLQGALIEEARLATQRLPVAFREVVVLVHIGGFSYLEVAGILGVPVGTVMSRLWWARRLLRAALCAGDPDRSGVRR